MRLQVKHLLICIGGLVLLALLYSFIFDFNDTKYTITVTDKERITESGSSRYLIFGEDENGDIKVFENTDIFIRGKWNSSDIYGNLKVGNTYNIVVVGYRVPFFSWYQNIVSYKEIKTTVNGE